MEFKVKGVRVRVSLLFWALLCLALIFETSYLMVIMLASIIFHELCHIVCMAAYGVEIKGIYFEPFGVIIEKFSDSQPPSQRIVVALAGALGNFIIAAVFAFVHAFFSSQMFIYIVFVNMCLGCFNILPVKGLDGGDVLSAVLDIIARSKKVDKDKILKLSSFLSLFLLCTAAVFSGIFYGFNISLIIVILNLAFVCIYKTIC